VRFEPALLACVLLLAGCDEKPAGPPPERFASVKKSAKPKGGSFCEKSYPASGEGARRYAAPALRAFGPADPAAAAAGWKWVNVWATWCQPCVEEMALLQRWRDGLIKGGATVSFEMVSIDEAEAQPALEEWRAKGRVPGPIRWIKDEGSFAAFLEGVGLDRGSAIPIHVLVDPAGMVRCVRVGAIHEQDYGSVRDLLAGGA
jgi:hypothetical protein